MIFFLQKKNYSHTEKCKKNCRKQNSWILFMVLTLKQNVTINSNPRDKRTMDILTLKKTERKWLLFNWSGFISSFFFGTWKLISTDRYPLIPQPLIYHWNYGKHYHFSSDLRTYIKVATHSSNCCHYFAKRNCSKNRHKVYIHYRLSTNLHDIFIAFGGNARLIFWVWNTR